MTLDPAEIAHWLRFCVGLLEFADTVDQEVLKPLLYKSVGATLETTSLRLVLKFLGMSREAKYFSGADGVIMDRRL